MRKLNINYHSDYILRILTVFIFAISILTLSGANTITESLKTSKNESFTFGGDAYLTSGIDDPVGDGWLRLTKDTIWQTGYAILNKAFPSELGILIDLEMMIWRKATSVSAGADGINIFLFDAKTPAFNIGAFGGSLGYAQYVSTSVTKPGVSAGYLGLGIDEFGNYSNPTEGRNGGPGYRSNAIGLRGSESLNYAWLTGNSKLSFNLQLGPYASRPNDDPSYRRLQIEISPATSGGNKTYSVTARMKTSKSGEFISIFAPYTLTYATPDSLKLGLAAATGIKHNFHDLRNVMISTTGGIRVEKTVNKAQANIGDTLIYTLDVFNQTPGLLSGLKLSDVFNQSDVIDIESVTFNNQFNNKNTASGFSKTQLSNINIDLDAYSNSQLVIKAIVKNYPSGGLLTNTANLGLGATGVNDPDISNNTAIVSTLITKNTKEIYLVKTVSNKKQFQLGEQIQYSFKVENPGGIALKNVTIVDNKLAAPPVFISGDKNFNNILEPGESWLYQGSYTVQQADIDSGKIVNQAVVNSFDPTNALVSDTSGITASDNLPTIIIINRDSKISLIKSVSSTGKYIAGSVVRYALTVNNEGNTALSNVSVIDSKILVPPVYQQGDINNNNLLDIGESWLYQAEYTVQPEDINTGSISNSATVTAKDPTGKNVSDVSGTTTDNDVPTVVFVDLKGKIALSKTIANTAPFNKGDEIRYSFAVKNEGNVKLKNVILTDLKLANAFTFESGDLNGNSELDINETWIYSSKYVVSQADMDAGFVSNIAEVTAQDPLLQTVKDVSGATYFEDMPTKTILPQNPKIAIIKTLSNSGVFMLGNIIKYDFTIANTGNVTLKIDSVIDNQLLNRNALYLSGDRNLNSFLDVNEIWTYTGSHKITQAEVDSGRVVNSASVYARDPLLNPLSDMSGSTTLNDNPTITQVAQLGKIALVKKVTGNKSYTLGSVINYTFTVTNTGTITLTNIVLTDDKINDLIVKTGVDANGKLDVGESWSYTATYIVTQADIDAGYVSNTATVTAKGPSGAEFSDISGSAINNNIPTVILINQAGRVSLVKRVISNQLYRKGDEVVYGFTVTNIGNVTLSQPVITDPKLNFVPSYLSGDLNSNNKLDVGESWTYEGKYLVTAADILNGTIINSAFVTCFDPVGNLIRDISGATAFDDNPVITIVDQDPMAVNDLATTKMDIEVVIPVLDNDKAAGSALDPSSVYVITEPQNGTVTVNDDGTITYLPNDSYVGNDFFTYIVKDIDGFTSAVTRVDVTVVDNQLIIPNVFTPNGDGFNDVFEISGLDSYNKAEIIIYNRWGNEVYKSNSYANDWDGSDLNEGTYYYVIKLEKRGKSSVYNGWVLLKRD